MAAKKERVNAHLFVRYNVRNKPMCESVSGGHLQRKDAFPFSRPWSPPRSNNWTESRHLTSSPVSNIRRLCFEGIASGRASGTEGVVQKSPMETPGVANVARSLPEKVGTET